MEEPNGLELVSAKIVPNASNYTKKRAILEDNRKLEDESNGEFILIWAVS